MALTGLNRKSTDKFYTKVTIVALCIEWLKPFIKKNDAIIEPSAGAGAFIPSLKKLSKNVKAYDIEPDSPEVVKQDYLLLNTEHLKTPQHVIGNPPFGRQSSLAKKFIKKSEFAQTIAFILPRSFKKASFQKCFPQKFHLVLEKDLPQNSFEVSGEDYDVPCIFQIWSKMSEDRAHPEKLEPQGYQFVKKTAKPDISFRRVGVYAGKASADCEDKSPQSHYFITFDNKQKNQAIIDKINATPFTASENTVGPKSISKQELITVLNALI
jgi:hypothetical protein